MPPQHASFFLFLSSFSNKISALFPIKKSPVNLKHTRFETATVNQAAPKQWFCPSGEPARANVNVRASTSQFESAQASSSPESQCGPCETAISARWLNWRQARFTVVVSLRVSFQCFIFPLLCRLARRLHQVRRVNETGAPPFETSAWLLERRLRR